MYMAKYVHYKSVSVLSLLEHISLHPAVREVAVGCEHTCPYMDNATTVVGKEEEVMIGTNNY